MRELRRSVHRATLCNFLYFVDCRVFAAPKADKGRRDTRQPSSFDQPSKLRGRCGTLLSLRSGTPVLARWSVDALDGGRL